jgi:uncharacterized membrane protein
MKKLVLLAAVLLVSVTSAYAQFRFTSIDYPGAVETRAYSINDNGLVVGRYVDSGGIRHGFLLKHGLFTTIDVPGATWTWTFGINNSGDIVGFYCYDCGGSHYGFLLSKGIFTTLSFPGSVDTYLYGMNNTGDIVGFYSYDFVFYQGFLYHHGRYTDVIPPGGTFNQDVLSIAINDAGVIVGNIVTDPNLGTVMGFSQSKDQYFTFSLQGAPFTAAQGINRNGDIAGTYAYVAGQPHGFLLSHAISATLDFPGAVATRPNAINSYNTIVGWYIPSDGTNHGLLVQPLMKTARTKVMR